MKTVRLNGKYPSSVQSPCDFEDIPVFFKMASAAKGHCSEVTVSKVSIGTILIGPTTIQAWRIVQDQNGNLVLGIRTSNDVLDLPEVYEVRNRRKTLEPVLVRLNFPAEERLRLFYQTYINA